MAGHALALARPYAGAAAATPRFARFRRSATRRRRRYPRAGAAGSKQTVLDTRLASRRQDHEHAGPKMAAPSAAILILSSQDLQAVMRFDDYVDAVAEAFQMLAEGRCESPVPMQINVAGGTFHAKAASLPCGPGYVAVKVNGNFPGNRSRSGLPTIQGAVFLADASDGRP